MNPCTHSSLANLAGLVPKTRDQLSWCHGRLCITDQSNPHVAFILSFSTTVLLIIFYCTEIKKTKQTKTNKKTQITKPPISNSHDDFHNLRSCIKVSSFSFQANHPNLHNHLQSNLHCSFKLWTAILISVFPQAIRYHVIF